MTGSMEQRGRAAPARARHAWLVTLAYVAFALLWIYFSDRALALLVDEPQRLAAATVKGFFFVFVTAALLFLALRTVPMADAPALEALWAAQTRSRRRAPTIWHGVALVLCLSATGLYLLLGTVLEGRLLVGLFMLPVLVSAMLGGLGPGLGASLMAGVGALIALGSVRGGIAQLHALDGLQLMFLLLNGLAVSLLGGRLRASLLGLSNHRQLLSAVVEGTNDAVFVKDLEGRYLMVNDATTRFVGRPREAILGRTDADLFPAESAAAIRLQDEAVIAGGVTRIHEELLHNHQGQTLVFRVTKGPWRDADGEVRGIFGISSDVSAEALREHEIARNADAMREAQALAHVGDWSWAPGGGHHRWSEEVYRIWGEEPSGPPLPFDELSHRLLPPGREMLMEAVNRAIRTGEPYAVDAQLQRRDGSVAWVILRGRWSPDGSGRMGRLNGTIQDITERKRAELALAEREAQLSRVLEGSDLGFWDWNVQTNAFQVSARWETMLGYEPGEVDVSVERWPELVHPDDFPSVMESVQQHLRGETPAHDIEMRGRTKDGGWRWIRTTGRVVSWDAEGRPLMMSGTHADISERKQLELALREAAMVFDSSLEGIMVVDPQMRIT